MKQPETHNNSLEQELKDSFDQWDAGAPNADMWSRMDESLSVASVWDRVDESLRVEGSTADQTLQEAFENWNPATNSDGWMKLQDELAKERVWNRLKMSLSLPIQTAVPWLQMIAATLVFFFLYFQFANEGLTYSPIQGANQSELNDGVEAQKENAETTTNGATGSSLMEQDDFENTPNEEYLDEKKEQNSTDVLPKLIAQNNTSNQSDELTQKGLSIKPITDFTKSIAEHTFKLPRRFSKPTWTVQFGPQFSVLSERGQSSLISSVPKVGISADILFNHYYKHIRFSQGFGFSQYAQAKGSYINGRYFDSNLKINTFQATTLLGYNFKGFTAFGGILLNRAINGYETQKNAVTNVYSIDNIQLGYTTGLDYQFKAFKNGTNIGVGAQYSFIPQLKSSNALFEKVQGAKIQIKFSF